MSSATSNNVSKWKKLNVSNDGSQCCLEIKEMKYCLSQKYGVTFNEHEGTIICRILDVCEGLLTHYSLEKLSQDPDMFADTFDTKLVDFYWVDENYVVLMLFNSLDQCIHHFGFVVDHQQLALLHSENEKSTSLTSADDSHFTNDDVESMPWQGGICPLTIRGENYAIVSTHQRLILNKFKPDTNFQGRQILNLCTDAKDDHLCGATPFAYGSNLYFVLHQLEAHVASNGDEWRKLYTDRLACVELSNLDLNQEAFIITDETVDFYYLPLTKLTSGKYFTMYDHVIRQQGQFLVIQETKVATISKKQTATKRRFFVIDLEQNTVSERTIRMKCDSLVTLIPDGVLVFRNNTNMNGTALQFKIETIGPNITLESIALCKLIMNGQLHQDCRHIFFKPNYFLRQSPL